MNSNNNGNKSNGNNNNGNKSNGNNNNGNKSNNNGNNSNNKLDYKKLHNIPDVYNQQICKHDNKITISVFIDMILYYLRVKCVNENSNIKNNNFDKCSFLYPSIIKPIIREYINLYETKNHPFRSTKIRKSTDSIADAIIIMIRDKLINDPKFNEENLTEHLKLWKSFIYEFIKKDFVEKYRKFLDLIFDGLIAFSKEYKQNPDVYFKDHMFNIFKTNNKGSLKNINPNHMYIRAHAGLILNNNNKRKSFKNELDTITTFNIFGCITVAPIYTFPNNAYKRVFHKGDIIPDVSFTVKSTVNNYLIYSENKMLSAFFISKGSNIITYDDLYKAGVLKYQGEVQFITHVQKIFSLTLSDIHDYLVKHDKTITGLELIGNCLSYPNRPENKYNRIKYIGTGNKNGSRLALDNTQTRRLNKNMLNEIIASKPFETITNPKTIKGIVEHKFNKEKLKKGVYFITSKDYYNTLVDVISSNNNINQPLINRLKQTKFSEKYNLKYVPFEDIKKHLYPTFRTFNNIPWLYENITNNNNENNVINSRRNFITHIYFPNNLNNVNKLSNDNLFTKPLNKKAFHSLILGIDENTPINKLNLVMMHAYNKLKNIKGRYVGYYRNNNNKKINVSYNTHNNKDDQIINALKQRLYNVKYISKNGPNKNNNVNTNSNVNFVLNKTLKKATKNAEENQFLKENILEKRTLYQTLSNITNSLDNNGMYGLSKDFWRQSHIGIFNKYLYNRNQSVKGKYVIQYTNDEGKVMNHTFNTHENQPNNKVLNGMRKLYSNVKFVKV